MTMVPRLCVAGYGGECRGCSSVHRRNARRDRWGWLAMRGISPMAVSRCLRWGRLKHLPSCVPGCGWDRVRRGSMRWSVPPSRCRTLCLGDLSRVEGVAWPRGRAGCRGSVAGTRSSRPWALDGGHPWPPTVPATDPRQPAFSWWGCREGGSRSGVLDGVRLWPLTVPVTDPRQPAFGWWGCR